MLAATQPNPQLLIWLGRIFGIGFGIGVLLIILGICAKILQAACRIVGEPAPETGRAMVTSFLESIAGGMIGFSGGVLLALFTAAGLKDPTAATVFMGGLQVTTGIIVPAALYVPMLNMSFRRGLAVSVVRVLITGFLILILALGIRLATGRIKL